MSHYATLRSVVLVFPSLGGVATPQTACLSIKEPDNTNIARPVYNYTAPPDMAANSRLAVNAELVGTVQH